MVEDVRKRTAPLEQKWLTEAKAAGLADPARCSRSSVRKSTRPTLNRRDREAQRTRREDERLEAALGLVAAVALFAMMALTFADVIGRKLLGASIPGSLELTELLMLAVIFVALPLTSLHGEHVVFDLLESVLPAQPAHLAAPHRQPGVRRAAAGRRLAGGSCGPGVRSTRAMSPRSSVSHWRRSTMLSRSCSCSPRRCTWSWRYARRRGPTRSTCRP